MTEVCQTATGEDRLCQFRFTFHDPPKRETKFVVMIGEELAIARALSSLADQLELAARDAIAAQKADPAHLVG